MQKNNLLFGATQYDAQSHLFPTRPGTDLGPKEIDFEMSFPKRKDRMKLSWLTQEGLEHFVRHYGADYEVLYIANSPRVREFEDLVEMHRNM